MYEEIYEINLQDKYVEGVIHYVQSVDGIPDWPELALRGFTWEQHMKINKLIGIEAMKYNLIEAILYNEITDNEIGVAEELIKKAIEEYNNM